MFSNALKEAWLDYHPNTPHTLKSLNMGLLMTTDEEEGIDMVPMAMRRRSRRGAEAGKMYEAHCELRSYHGIDDR